MSTILDALRRLQSQREGPARGADLRRMVTQLPGRRATRGATLGALVVGLAIGAGFWAVWRHSGPAQEPTIPSATSPASASPSSSAVAAAAPIARVPAASRAAMRAPPVEIDAALAEPPARRRVAPPPPTPARAVAPSATVVRPVTPTPEALAAAAAPVRVAQAEPAQPPPPVAPREPAPQAPAARPVAEPRAISDAPLEPAGDLGFPEIRVQSIRWHPDEARRSADVVRKDGSRAEVRQGDIIEGAIVRRIEPASLEIAVGSRRRRLTLAP